MLYEFYYNCPENLIRVEVMEDSVLIRATKDNFSEIRKDLFIKWLAKEGFISDSFQFTNVNNVYGGVQWIVDSSWVEVPREAVAISNRRHKILFIGAVILWAIVMAGIYFRIKHL